tara:strand:+ start:608 stop:952 length:345 start_codon:yes stop_codon:yes gene_type:complete
MAHETRRWFRRFAISVAAVRVNVKHSICCGGVPPSSKRKVLSVKAFVFPVPAEADTQADVLGSEASRWRFFVFVTADARVIVHHRPKTILKPSRDAGMHCAAWSDRQLVLRNTE